MMKKTWFGVLLLLFLMLIVGAYLMISSRQTPADRSFAVLPVDSTEDDIQMPTGLDSETGKPIKEFEVTGDNFSFDVKEIRVKKGDRVRIRFVNSEGMHDWKLDEFQAGTSVLKAGESESVEFTADKTGTFEYYCSVGKHREMGMVGSLIVEDN